MGGQRRGGLTAKIALLGAFSALAGALALSTQIQGCNVYDASLLELDQTDRPEAKNGIGWWSKNDDRGCFSAGMPRLEDRPGPSTDKDVGPIILAVESMRLGSLNERGEIDPNAWQDLGFDIDGICTASSTCESADPPPSCKTGASALPRDGRYCRDNTFGRLEHSAALVPEISKEYGLSDDAFNCELCVGHYNFIIRVTGYSGEPNDDRVRVDLYPSPGLEKPLPWDCRDPSWRTRPCFQPDMPWTLAEDSLNGPIVGQELPPSKIFDEQAYVRDGSIIVHLPDDTLFWFPGYGGVVVAYPLRIQKGIVAGKIFRGADSVWRIRDGIIAGGTRGDDLLRGFRLIGFCESTDQANFELMATFIRSNLDVLADGRIDSNAPCDAMSLGVGFTALQARAGRTAPAPAPLVECVKPRTGSDAGDGG